jgi:hypothetical protein
MSQTLEIDAGDGEVFTVEQLAHNEFRSVFPTRLQDKEEVHTTEAAAWRYVHGYINLERSKEDTTMRQFTIVSEAVVKQEHVVQATSFDEAFRLWANGEAGLFQEETVSQSDPQVVDGNTGAWILYQPTA